MSVESPARVEQFLLAFGNEDYWRARLAIGDSAATLKSLTVDPDGTVSVVVAASLLRDRLPKLITQLHRADLEVVQNERWSRIDGGRLRGEISVAAPGTPLSGFWEVLVAPVRNGSRLNYTATVKVNVPLVGGTIERLIGDQLPEGIVEGGASPQTGSLKSVDAHYSYSLNPGPRRLGRFGPLPSRTEVVTAGPKRLLNCGDAAIFTPNVQAARAP